MNNADIESASNQYQKGQFHIRGYSNRVNVFHGDSIFIYKDDLNSDQVDYVTRFH